MKYLKLSIFTILMIFAVWLLHLLAVDPLFSFNFFDKDIINTQLNYQLSGLLLAVVVLIVIRLFASKTKLSFLRLRRTGTMHPTKLLGMREPGKWENDGIYFGLIMVGIIGIVTFFQTFNIDFDFHWMSIIIIIPLAASNAFIEEVIFRLSFVTVGDNETNSKWYGLVMGALVFGVTHYWGIVPNGIFGVIISAYLGYFLAKSMQETRGFYWAFLIHFLLDVVILFFLFNLEL